MDGPIAALLPDLPTVSTVGRVEGVAMRDRGSMLVMTVLVGLTLTASVLIAITPVLTGLVHRQRARAAADAAALAGVVGGRAAAAELAGANGGTLVEWSEQGDEVTVVVVVDGHRARARATDAP